VSLLRSLLAETFPSALLLQSLLRLFLLLLRPLIILLLPLLPLLLFLGCRELSLDSSKRRRRRQFKGFGGLFRYRFEADGREGNGSGVSLEDEGVREIVRRSGDGGYTGWVPKKRSWLSLLC
jgi:hypothetical protein